MLDPTIISAATSALESAANKALQYDPATRQRLAQLQSQSLAVEITELSLKLCVHFESDGLRLSAFSDNPTTKLRGSLPGLLKLAVVERSTPAEAKIEITGDSGLLIEVKAILADLELDWEEILVEGLGDVAGHQLAVFLRKQVNWIRERESSARRLVSEFLTEELRAIPTPSEVDYFNQQVDQLHLSADRLTARFDALRTAFSKNGGAN